ncbi:MAG: ParB N-terminal domain-containing protein [Thermofilaceae archaeon]
MEQVTFIPLDKLVPSSVNVRVYVDQLRVRDLAENISVNGLLHPLVVRPEGKVYGIICGRMRFEAIKLLHEESPEIFTKLFSNGVPCFVKELSDREAVELSLSENLRQNNLTPEEVGRAVARLYEQGLEEEDIRRRVQLPLEDIKRFVRLYARLREITPFTAESRPGRPSPRRRRVSRTGMEKVVRVVENLERQGLVEKPEEVTRKLAEIASEKKLSTSELEILAHKLREKPELVRKPEELSRLADEIAGEEMVERIVLLRRKVIDDVSEYAKLKGLTFNEAVNELLERALSRIRHEQFSVH